MALKGAGETWGLMGPLGDDSSLRAGHLVRVRTVEQLPRGCVYWCKAGDKEWTPIPEAIKEADIWWTEKMAIKNAKLAKKRLRRGYIAMKAFEEGKSLEQVEQEVAYERAPVDGDD